MYYQKQLSWVCLQGLGLSVKHQIPITEWFKTIPATSFISREIIHHIGE
jgi:hypothetical protein